LNLNVKESLLREGFTRLETGDIPAEEIQEDIEKLQRQKEHERSRKEQVELANHQYNGKLMEL
jgi:hypothetical protein